MDTLQKFIDNFIKGNDIAKKFYALNLGVRLYSKGDGIPWLFTREVKSRGDITYEFAPEDSLIVGISFLRVLMVIRSIMALLIL